MYKGIYKIADVVMEFQTLYLPIHHYCSKYRWDGEPELEICIEQKDIDFERAKSAREDEIEGLPVRNHPDAYLESLAVYRKMADTLITRDITLLHGSVVCVDDKAVLFTAKSGTGKSTHTRLWRELFGQRAIMVNDDKPLLRVTDTGVMVYGTPWDGKHRLSTNCVKPLEAICILERGEKNEIHPISAKEALPMLMQQSHRSTKPSVVAQQLKVLDKLSSKVRFYRLKCNMDPEAAEIAYNGIFG